MEGQWLSLEIHMFTLIFSFQFSKEEMQVLAGGVLSTGVLFLVNICSIIEMYPQP